MTEIILSIAVAAITIGFVAAIGLSIASHFDILNQDEWN